MFVSTALCIQIAKAYNNLGFVLFHRVAWGDWDSALCMTNTEIHNSSHSYSLEIHVFAWRRSKSLKRLLLSLQAPQYGVASLSQQITLYIHVDGNALESVQSLVENFVWKLGHKVILDSSAETNRGLLASVAGARQRSKSYAASKNHSSSDYVLFLEDDIELSPIYLSYVDKCISKSLLPPSDARLAGCSLYTPRVDEITGPLESDNPRPWVPQDALKSNSRSIFHFQLPCSWGAVWKASVWDEFIKDWLEPRVYLENRHQLNSIKRQVCGKKPQSIIAFPPIPNLHSHLWKKSWKRFMIEYFFVRGLYMIYPNFPNQASFSTNHFEEGIHNSPSWKDAREIQDRLQSDHFGHSADTRFTVPLLQNLNSLGVTWGDLETELKLSTNIPIVDIYHELAPGYETLTKRGHHFLQNICDTTVYQAERCHSDRLTHESIQRICQNVSQPS